MVTLGHIYLGSPGLIGLNKNGQINWSGLGVLCSVVDYKLSIIQGISHPDFQRSRVAFLTIWADSREMDAFREHLSGPGDLIIPCESSMETVGLSVNGQVVLLPTYGDSSFDN